MPATFLQSAFLRLWGWPIVLGLLTASGLLSALVSESVGDWWSWIALGIPVAVMAWFGWRRPHAPSSAATTTTPTDSEGSP